MHTSESSPHGRSRRWRYSLRTLLLLMVVVGLGIVVIVQSQGLWRAEQELVQLRDETGRLTIEDRNKVHVMYVGSSEPRTWRWRIFIPKDRRYVWSLTAGEIPATGLPKPTTNAVWNAQGEEVDKEVLVTASLQKTEEGGWRLSVSSRIGNSDQQMGGARIEIADQLMESVHTGCEEHNVLGIHKTPLLDPHQPIVLIKHRACGVLPDGTEGLTEAATPGYMIWMSPF